jgi:hypothetical protein
MNKLVVFPLALAFVACLAVVQGCSSEPAPLDDGGDAGTIPDGSYVDAGPDGGPDAGPDGGMDAGLDAGPDGGIDAGLDAGPDAGPDAGVDAGADAGVDAGPLGPFFGTPVVSGVAPYVGQMAAADFNGDGHLDLVVSLGAHTYDRNFNIIFAGTALKVLLGNGDGSFQSPITLQTGLSPHGVAVLDIDGDGLPDIAVGVCQSGNDHLSYFLNKGGDAGFAARQDLSVGTCPYALALVDGLSGAGQPGLAIAGPGPYWLDAGTGEVDTFITIDGGLQLAGSLSTTEVATAVTAADFNGDGITDLAASTSIGTGVGDSQLLIWLAVDGGSWQSQNSTSLDNGTYRAMAAGDLDGNGNADVALVSSDNSMLTILTGNGDGTFAAPTYQGVTDPPVELTLGHFGRSDALDVAMATVGSPFIGMTVFPGTHDSSVIGPEQRILSDGTGYGVAQGDFNGDGLVDVVIALRNLDAVAMVPSLSGPPFLPDPMTYRPADHTPVPPVAYHGGPVISHPQLITITYQDDTNTAVDQAFDEWIIQSKWLETIGADYGVSLGSNMNVVLPGSAPTSLQDSDVQNILVALIADGGLPAPVVPDGGGVPDQLYMFWFPYTTTISGTSLGVSCQSFGAYHNEDDVGVTPFAYAVIPTCDPYSPYYQEVSASHELAEASSDPLVQTAPAYTSNSFNNGWIGEIGDLCTPFDSFYLLDGGTYMAVQRIWSNSAVEDAGTQPCIPAAPMAYAALTPDGGINLPNACDSTAVEACTSVFPVTAGQTYDLELTGWISQPSVAAAVIVVPYGVASLLPVEFNPNLTMDRYNFHNGDVAHLTVGVPSGTPSQSVTVFTVLSGFDNDNYAYWPIVLYVQ